MSLPLSKLGAELVRYKADVARKADSSASSAARKTVKAAQKASSGRISAAESAARGYVYSTRHPVNYQGVDDSIINVQTGAFKAAWNGYGRLEPAGLHVHIENRNRVADWLDKGTKRMRQRPIRYLVQRAGEKILVQEIIRRFQ